MLVIGIQNGFGGCVVKKTNKSGGNGFVGSELMILADFVLIMKGVKLGNIVFHFCCVGRRLECCMSNRGKLFCLILFAGLQQVRLLQFEFES